MVTSVEMVDANSGREDVDALVPCRSVHPSQSTWGMNDARLYTP